MVESSDAHDRDSGSTGESRTEEMTNERFRLLVHRALKVDRDYAATIELRDYILRKIRKKVESFPKREQDDASQTLLLAAWKAASQIVEKQVDLPRNYVIRATTYSYIGMIAAHKRIRENEITHHSPENEQNRISLPTNWEAESQNVEEHLSNLRRNASTDVEKKVAETLTVCFAQHVTLAEACELLAYGPTEASTVARTIRRHRDNPKTALGKLVIDITENDNVSSEQEKEK